MTFLDALNNKISEVKSKSLNNIKRIEVGAIESIYNTYLSKLLGIARHPGRIKSSKNSHATGARSCDGYFEHKTPKGRLLRCIAEYKYNSKAHDFKTDTGIANALIQVIFYMHDMKTKISGVVHGLPNVIMLADQEHCIIIPVNKFILSILDYDLNWECEPSSAYKHYGWVVNELRKHIALGKIRCCYYGVDSNFTVKSVVSNMYNIVDGSKLKPIEINKENLKMAFEDFCDCCKKDRSKSSFVEFCDCIRKKKTVSGFEKFKKIWRVGYDQNDLCSIMEKVYDCFPMEERRLVGDFYVPSNLVTYVKGDSGMNRVFGKNWENEYVIWDPDCKMGDMVRGLKCKRGGLYCSSSLIDNVNIVKMIKPSCKAFQFDFLNDDLEKLPNGLKNAFKSGRKCIVFCNPASATGCNHGESSKKDVAKGTKMHEIMRNAGIGRCSENILAQLLYRIILIKREFKANISLSFFGNPIYLSGGSWIGFRKEFFSDFDLIDGFLIKAREFGCKDWGISFSMCKPR